MGDTPQPSHLDETGRARMVDVGAKDVTERSARAEAVVVMGAETARLLEAGALPKGDAITIARVAGIQAAKRTADLIPLCHPIALTSVEVEVSVVAAEGRVTVGTSANARDRTGVEMEALVAASIAALTLYDMVKSIDRGAYIESVRLTEKRGGASGTWQAT